MLDVGYYNGKIGRIEEITVPMSDRAVYFGDGVYEAAFVRNNKIFAIDDHLDRFYRSLELLSINFGMDRGGLKTLLFSLTEKLDDKGDAVLYWQSSRGTAPRGHSFPKPDVKPSLLAYVKAKPLGDIKKKIKLLAVEDERYLYCHIKTLNLIPSVLASQKAAEHGCEEAVFHRGAIVTECSHSNVSILKDGVFKTAPLSKYILAGTVRKHVIEYCATNGIPVDETAFTLQELMNADEIVVTSALSFIRSACEIDGTAVGGKAPALLEKIQNAYLQRTAGEIGE